MEDLLAGPMDFRRCRTRFDPPKSENIEDVKVCWAGARQIDDGSAARDWVHNLVVRPAEDSNQKAESR